MRLRRINGQGSNARVASMIPLMMIQTTRTLPKVMMNLQLPPNSAILSDKMFAKAQLALELFLDVFGQHFMLSQTLDDFVIERRELADFILERLLDVISAEGAEIGEANELLRVPVVAAI
jgi:hypothetical protein